MLSYILSFYLETHELNEICGLSGSDELLFGDLMLESDIQKHHRHTAEGQPNSFAFINKAQIKDNRS